MSSKRQTSPPWGDIVDEPPDDISYPGRMADGLYDDLCVDITNMGKGKALAFCKYLPGDSDGDFVRGEPTGNRAKFFHAGRDGDKPFKCNVFGEVATCTQGTKMTAMGAHYTGTSAKPNIAKGKTNIRDVIALRLPSFADQHEGLFDLFGDQFCPLYDLKRAEEERDNEEGQSFTYRLPILNAEQENAYKRLTLHFPLKYVSSDGDSSTSGSVRSCDRAGSAKAVKASSTRPPPPYTVGQLYPPTVLSDFAGHPLLKNHSAKLVQQNIRDIDGNLVPPWEAQEVLKPGTVVIAKVSPVMYFGSEKKDAPFDRKTVHLEVSSIHVMALSPEKAEYPPPPFGAREKDLTVDDEDNEDILDLKIVKRRKAARSSVSKGELSSRVDPAGPALVPADESALVPSTTSVPVPSRSPSNNSSSTLDSSPRPNSRKRKDIDECVEQEELHRVKRPRASASASKETTADDDNVEEEEKPLKQRRKSMRGKQEDHHEQGDDGRDGRDRSGKGRAAQEDGIGEDDVKEKSSRQRRRSSQRKLASAHTKPEEAVADAEDSNTPNTSRLTTGKPKAKPGKSRKLETKQKSSSRSSSPVPEPRRLRKTTKVEPTGSKFVDDEAECSDGSGDEHEDEDSNGSFIVDDSDFESS